MYEYVNTKTGARIFIESRISGNGWEEVVKTSPKQPAKPAKKKATKEKS